MSNDGIDCLANQVVAVQQNVSAAERTLRDLDSYPTDGRGRRIRNSAGAYLSQVREALARGDQAAAARHLRNADYATGQLTRYLDQN